MQHNTYAYIKTYRIYSKKLSYRRETARKLRMSVCLTDRVIVQFTEHYRTDVVIARCYKDSGLCHSMSSVYLHVCDVQVCFLMHRLHFENNSTAY